MRGPLITGAAATLGNPCRLGTTPQSAPTSEVRRWGLCELLKSVGLFSDGNEFGYIQNRSLSVLRTGGSLRVSGINDGLSEAQQQNRKDGIACDGNADQDAALGFGKMQLHESPRFFSDAGRSLAVEKGGGTLQPQRLQSPAASSILGKETLRVSNFTGVVPVSLGTDWTASALGEMAAAQAHSLWL